MVTEEQFIQLLVRHESEFRGFARSLMPDPAQADDLVQEACLAMWRKFQTLDGEMAFRSWAYSYIRLTAFNLRRKRQRSRLVFSAETMEMLSEEWDEISELAEARRDTLATCMEELAPKQKHLLANYYGSTKGSAVELAERMQRPVEGIYKALGRIRAILRVCIKDKLEAQGFSR